MLEPFHFSPSHETALDSCFVASSNRETGSTFAENALGAHLLSKKRRRHGAAILAAAALAGCATAPARPPAHAGAAGALSLCSMGAIANAPAADERRRIKDFTPTFEIRGVRLARAPVAACLSSGFGPRNGGASGFHHGVDLYTRAPAPVYAGGDGVVEDVSTQRGYGKTILVRHGHGVKTRYAHLSSYAPGAKRGARLRAGELVGRTGETGNATAVHLHYEVIIDGEAVNPLNVGRRR